MMPEGWEAVAFNLSRKSVEKEEAEKVMALSWVGDAGEVVKPVGVTMGNSCRSGTLEGLMPRVTSDIPSFMKS